MGQGLDGGLIALPHTLILCCPNVRILSQDSGDLHCQNSSHCMAQDAVSIHINSRSSKHSVHTLLAAHQADSMLTPGCQGCDLQPSIYHCQYYLNGLGQHSSSILAGQYLAWHVAAEMEVPHSPCHQASSTILPGEMQAHHPHLLTHTVAPAQAD